MAKRLTKAEKEVRRASAEEILRDVLHEGDTVYTVVKSVSRSGMYRHIVLLAWDGERIRNISGRAAQVMDWRWHDDNSIGVSGCGMDMGFHAVYTLAACLFRTVGHRGRDGYKLNHEWL